MRSAVWGVQYEEKTNIVLAKRKTWLFMTQILVVGAKAPW